MVDGDRLPIDPDDVRVLKNAALRHAESFPIMAFPLKGGGWWPLYDEQFTLLCETWSNSVVVYELRVAFAWLMANPHRRKTKRGMLQFLNGWMDRSRRRS